MYNDIESSPFSELDFWNDSEFVLAAAHDRQMDPNSPFKANYMGMTVVFFYHTSIHARRKSSDSPLNLILS